ncbi:MAG TPA: AMP-binding protein [Pseudonocardiaceae bacterium]
MSDITCADRFATVARGAPDAIALRHNAVGLTYRALAGQAGGVAALLRDRGVRPGDLVATVLDRSPLAVAAKLGIWATGASHAHLDAVEPDSRIARTLAAADARAVLTDRRNARRVPGSLVLDQPTVAPYEPVGTVRDHIMGLCQHIAPIPDRVTSTTDLGDACALLSGGTLDLVDRATALDPKAFAARLRAQPAGMLACTPSELESLFRQGEPADFLPTDVLVLDGDGFPAQLAGTVFDARPNLAVFNHHGMFLERFEHVDRRLTIGGHRVEPADVEDVLLAQRGIREAVVTGEQASQDGPTELVAYLVGLADHADLLRRLRQRLPASHVPNRLHQVARIPLTREGRTSFTALRKLAARKPVARQCPRTATERLIADIWCDVLKHVEIGLHARFDDLGGNPAKSRAVVGKLRRHFPGLTVAQLADHPTVAELAAALDANAGPGSTTVVRV